ncbi:hypothetical protein MHB81_03035 [Paenibacillus sp. FSL H7-0326]
MNRLEESFSVQDAALTGAAVMTQVTTIRLYEGVISNRVNAEQVFIEAATVMHTHNLFISNVGKFQSKINNVDSLR